MLFVYGYSTIGRALEGDATAFYFAAAKLIAYSGRIGTVPGYEGFSWVIMTGEMLYASLIVLGAPGVSARFYEWVNFAPALIALYSVARICNLSARAAFLAVTMALTSSAAIGLWGGGKTDTFAVGPALIGVWFALASWQSIHRTTFVAMSGLFCGLAIVTKVSYLLVLLPGALLMIFWLDIAMVIASAKVFDWNNIYGQAKRITIASLPFFGGVALAVAPFVIKNFIIFHSSDASQLSSDVYYSTWTTLRLIASYPFALTYGRYWAQLGTLSPLILAFCPLYFLIPSHHRQPISALVALTVSTILALAIWMVLMPSIFMPRYILATLLLLSIPAAAGAAYASRRTTAPSVTIVLAVAITIATTPNQVASRSPIFYPWLSLVYFLNGQERPLFIHTDPYFATSTVVNNKAMENDRVLLLVYPRLWLRGDLLAVASTSSEVKEATNRLKGGSDSFWKYLEEKRFRFLIVDNAHAGEISAAAKSMPRGFHFCNIQPDEGIGGFQIGRNCNACPSGDRTALPGPFPRLWADGNAFVAIVPSLASIGDSSPAPFSSPVVVCEDEMRLGPPHTVHLDIREQGRGRFSHWAEVIYFSTSDNSDPSTNGRVYTAVQPR